MTKMIKYLTIGFLWWLAGLQGAVAANNLHDASNIVKLQHACPGVWEKVDKIIGSRPGSVPYANETDRQQHITFQKNYIVDQTKTGSRDRDAASRDVPTVFTQCLELHNLVVRAEFGKTIGELPILQEKHDIMPILMLLLLGED